MLRQCRALPRSIAPADVCCLNQNRDTALGQTPIEHGTCVASRYPNLSANFPPVCSSLTVPGEGELELLEKAIGHVVAHHAILVGPGPLAFDGGAEQVIQERKVRPLGAQQEESVDVRIVSATHRDLAADVQSGRFRQDLYYRLNVIEIFIPPLRERREDLPSLCDILLQRIAKDSGQTVPPMNAVALQTICAYALEGNVRELENLLLRSVALSDSDVLRVEPPQQHAPPSAPPVSQPYAPSPMPAPSVSAVAPRVTAPLYGTVGSPAGDAAPASTGGNSYPCDQDLPNDLQAWLDDLERDILVRALKEFGFNRTATANRLGISLRQIRYRMERLQIADPSDGARHQ